MVDLINTAQITNFKSLKHVTLSDCKRINVLIGKPNVGKSNILEALGVFGLSSSLFNKNKRLSQFIRFENIPELFFNGNTDIPIIIELSDGRNESVCEIGYQNTDYGDTKHLSISTLFRSGRRCLLDVDDKFDISLVFEKSDAISIVKQYRFSNNAIFEKINLHYLLPPFGVNLLSVLQAHKNLRVELSKIISEYGWKLNIDTANHSLRILKELGEDTIFTLPYSSIADTLQRLIFFKAAIASNQNTILLFEEPEAHCFPPYIRQITQDIIDSETNQFFIATHSPYVLNDFLEDKETRQQLAIYMADFKDGQTVVYRLTDEELDEVYNYGIDVFFNYERFTAHG